MMSISYFLFLFFLFTNPIQNGVLEWQTFTSMNDVRKIIFINDEVYNASDGGFFIYNKSNNSYEIINNTSGLSYNDIRSMIIDGQGKIWIGLGNGFVDVLEPKSKKFDTIVIDVQDFTINDFVIRGNEIYFATNFGISQYLIDKKEIKSNFRKLGGFDKNTPVKKIYILNDEIWAGTNFGIAKSNLNYPNLQDPQFWQNFTKNDNLPDNIINGFIEFNNRIYTATERGVAYFDGTKWIKIIDGLSERISDFAISNGNLYAGAFSGVYILNEKNLWQTFGKPLWDINVINFDKNGTLWAGTKSNGLFSYNLSNGEWLQCMPNLPNGNYFTSMDIDKNGIIWATSGQFGNKGIYSYDGKVWKNFDINDGISSNNVISIKIDKKNIKWFGTPGNGAFTIEGDDFKIVKYDTTNGKLAGSDTPSFVIVDDIGIDVIGNIWLLNRYANNGKALVAITPDFKWNYFSTSDGLNSVELSAITFDKSGRVWLGTSGVSPRGLIMLDHKGTLGNKSDDIWKYYTTSDGLVSNDINALTIDNYGYVWVGTPEGVNYFDGEKFRNVFGLFNDYINCITIDPFDNKWFGTKNGISVLDRYNYKWKYYNQNNSGLVDNNVLSIAINEKTGDVFIGTEKGLSKAKTTYSKSDVISSKLIVYPNPFIISEGNNLLVIGDLTSETVVKIFSSSGRLIKELSEENGNVFGAKAFWDGKDSDNNPVPSGIYILVANSENGNIKKGKVALIRK